MDVNPEHYSLIVTGRHNSPADVVFMKAYQSGNFRGIEVHVDFGVMTGSTLECVLEKIENHTLSKPSFMLGKSEAQSLMDSLWQCGVRPASSENIDFTKSVLALEQKRVDRLIDCLMPVGVIVNKAE